MIANDLQYSLGIVPVSRIIGIVSDPYLVFDMQDETTNNSHRKTSTYDEGISLLDLSHPSSPEQ